ncbi:MAG: hypothetical protein U1E40_06060 [Amaricoccus sp.]
MQPGQIVILNGAPRSGKSSIARALQSRTDTPWINLGVDASMATLPPHLHPGIGLRPGGERPDLEPLVATLYAALYESIAAHSRLGLAVVADVGHHDRYSKPLGILPDAARRLTGLPVLFVGVRCPLATILARRAAAPVRGLTHYETPTPTGPPPAVLAWESVHEPGIYDLQVDTSELTSDACVDRIIAALSNGPTVPSVLGWLVKLH